MRRAALAAVVALLAVAAPASASSHLTVSDLEDEVICPTCRTTLDMSTAPVADRMRVFIRQRIEAGDSKQEIKDALVAQFGRNVLAEPPRSGFAALAWLLPLAGVALAAVAVGAGAWYWSRRRVPELPLDADDERRVEDALARFDV